MTGEQLGERVGVSKGAVSHWESDNALPGLENIVAICEALEISTDYLLRGVESDYLPPSVMELSKRLAGLDEKGLETIRTIFSNLPPKK